VLAIGEEIQRGPGLFEDGPEDRVPRREEHATRHTAVAVTSVVTETPEQPAEEQQRDHQTKVAYRVRD
jgi:hypothetical protein